VSIPSNTLVSSYHQTSLGRLTLNLLGNSWAYFTDAFTIVLDPTLSLNCIPHVRPHLEYAAPVWHPCTAMQKHKKTGKYTETCIENMFSKQWDDLGYQDLLDLAKCPLFATVVCILSCVLFIRLIYFPVDISQFVYSGIPLKRTPLGPVGPLSPL